MLQFITAQSDRYSLMQEVEMAIAGGCRWIELRMDHITGNERHEAMKTAAEEIKTACKEADAFLVINGDVELAIEAECHGVHLNRGDMKPTEAREKMGPAAVIGVTVDTADEIITLKHKDIDYVTLDTADTDKIQEIVTAVRQAGVKIPIVAAGNVTTESIPKLMEAGVNGVAASKSVIEAEKPEEYIRQLLSKCR